MRWIHEAAHACAATWSSRDAEASYTGGVRFHRPIGIGELVEVDARILHTGPTDMHLSVQVRSGDLTRPDELALASHCICIFVVRGAAGTPLPIAPLALQSAEDERLDAHGRELIDLRMDLTTVPITLPVSG